MPLGVFTDTTALNFYIPRFQLQQLMPRFCVYVFPWFLVNVREVKSSKTRMFALLISCADIQANVDAKIHRFIADSLEMTRIIFTNMY